MLECITGWNSHSSRFFVCRGHARDGPRCRNGMRFPNGCSRGKHVPVWDPEWDAASRWAPKRKAHPGISLQSGMLFPNECLRESASRNLPLKWDALSQRRLSGKFIPESTLKMGRSFPTGALWVPLIPEFSSKAGCGFPMTVQPETASHYSISKWDALSG